MSDERPDPRPAENQPLEPMPSQSTGATAAAKHIYLVPYPKIIFFYPSLLTAIVLAIWMMITGRYNVAVDDHVAVAMTWAFLCVFGINLIVITFDFPRATSLTLLFFVFALVLGGVLLMTFYPGLMPAVAALLANIRPVANATFFIIVAAILVAVFVAVSISVRFNYWEVRPNELLHHHGFLSDLKRYSAPNLRVDKEINDVFEYLLLRSGRLILQPSSERRAIILDNVPFISTKEQAITAMLGAVQVQVRNQT